MSIITKKHFLFVFTIFSSLLIQGQTFEVNGDAKLITTWFRSKPKEVGELLSSGDKLSIRRGQSTTDVFVFYKNSGRRLASIDDGDYADEFFIKVYEYDFDNDGQKEIIIAYYDAGASTIVEVFRYSNGLSERVGKFYAQLEMTVNKNSLHIHHALGRKNLDNEYIYKYGSFYELIYHNPNKD